MNNRTPQRIAIVGGGVIGCAIARELSADYDVTVFERGQIAGEATALAAGEVTMLSAYADYPKIGWHAVEFFREYDGTDELRYTELPSVGLIPPNRTEAERAYVAELADRGLPVEFLDRETVAERYPGFDLPDGFSGIEHGISGFVDPYTFAITLKTDAEANGATFHTDTTVSDLQVEDGSVVGIVTDNGSMAVDHVIAAAGWRTRAFLCDHVPIPVRPYRTQCLVLHPSEPLADGFPMGSYPGEHIYFRPEHNGDLLVGGWSFAESTPETASRNEDEAFRQHVAEIVPTFLRGFERSSFVDGWAGVDGATPDTRPIVDTPSEGPDGLLIATGFHGRGVMTAPVAATAARSLIAGTAPPFPLEPFQLDRFETRSDDFEFTSISAGD